MGYSYLTTGGDLHAFITEADGMGMRNLGTLGGRGSLGFGINDDGQVVGYSETAEGVDHAFITGPGGEGMTDLNSLVDLPQGVVLTQAIDINNNGQVLAIGIVPEPETYALMLSGLGLIGFIVRRKKGKTPRHCRSKVLRLPERRGSVLFFPLIEGKSKWPLMTLNNCKQISLTHYVILTRR